MMLWLHLFSDLDITEQCTNTIFFWNGKPLAFVLKKLCSMCVPMYIFLGGYGLAKTYISNVVERKHGMNNGKRVLSLYANFWTIFLMAYPIGFFVNKPLYASSVGEVMANIIALDSTFNGAWWFLLPYAVLTLFSSYFIRFLYQSSPKHIALYFVFATLLFVISYIRVENIPSHDFFALLELNFWRCANMLLTFSVGVMFALHNVIEHVRLPKQQLWLWCMLACLILAKLSIGASSLIHPPFVFAMVILWCNLRHSKLTENILFFFGKHSTNMWLVHYFFFTSIASGELYSLRYPVIIYMVLVCASILASVIISFMFKPLRDTIRR